MFLTRKIYCQKHNSSSASSLFLIFHQISGLFTDKIARLQYECAVFSRVEVVPEQKSQFLTNNVWSPSGTSRFSNCNARFISTGAKYKFVYLGEIAFLSFGVHALDSTCRAIIPVV